LFIRRGTNLVNKVLNLHLFVRRSPCKYIRYRRKSNPKTLNTYCSILTPASSVLLNTFHLAENLFSLTQSWHRQLPTRNGRAKILTTAPSWQNAKRKIWTSALLPFSFQHARHSVHCWSHLLDCGSLEWN